MMGTNKKCDCILIADADGEGYLKYIYKSDYPTKRQIMNYDDDERFSYCPKCGQPLQPFYDEILGGGE